MDQQPDKLNQLAQKLQKLIEQQELISGEINILKSEFNEIKKEEVNPSQPEVLNTSTEVIADISNEINQAETKTVPNFQYDWPPKRKEKSVTKDKKINFERFIGENLISKIGILILIIGVAIGSKYAIENHLINQLTRIVIGYVIGVVLLLFAIKLKKKFEAFSSVLLSGALAIFYFITYTAYSAYHLIPLPFTFALLLVFTLFTVVAAITYNRQIIAHIGLVGAYAIPILLSTDSGNIKFLLSYITLINAGILFISVKRYWKPLYISAFFFSWLVLLIWFNTDYIADQHFTITAIFNTVFFVMFFVTFLIYKLIRKAEFVFLDVMLIISNSFIFYGIGYFMLMDKPDFAQYTGVFTLITALLHFVFSYSIYKNKLADRNLLYLVSGLVLTFITITFPVQFNGSWVTLLWAGETLFLFWIGRTQKVKFYEYISYVLIFLSFISIVHDWGSVYSTYYSDSETSINTFFNVNFLTSLVLVVVYSYVFYLDRNKKFSSFLSEENIVRKIMSISIPVLLIVTAYFAFRLEIAAYWNQLFNDTKINLLSQTEDPYPISEWNYDIRSFKTIWLVNFTLLFLSIISLLNIALKNKPIYCWINQGINILAFPICFSLALWHISELRESYLAQEMAEYFKHGFYNITIRYISVLFLTSFIFSIYRLYVYLNRQLTVIFDILLASAILWFLSSELLHWLDIYGAASIYKLGLSILWGAFALILVAYGIWKRKAHVRIAAFALLGITLLKMFFYDLNELNTLSKAIIFISIGILMLGVSFLYNKFKYILFNDATN